MLTIRDMSNWAVYDTRTAIGGFGKNIIHTWKATVYFSLKVGQQVFFSLLHSTTLHD